MKSAIQMPFPVRGHGADGSWDRLVNGVAGRVGGVGSVSELVGAVVVEPVLFGLEALDDRMPGLLVMRACVLARGVVAAADVAAAGASAQVQPPSRGGARQALQAAGAARWDVGSHLGVYHCHVGLLNRLR